MRKLLLLVSLMTVLLYILSGCGGPTGPGGGPTYFQNAASVSGGAYFSLALKDNGTVWAWGANTGNGYYGNGTTTESDTPVQASITNASAIASGCRRSLALKSDGTVWGWGEVGSYTGGTYTSISKTPIKIDNLANITAISAGYIHSMVLKNDGTVWSWGTYLGNGTGNSSTIPVKATSLTDVIAISCSWWYHSLALKSDGTVWRWGLYSYDSGLGNIGCNAPEQVPNLTNIIAISGGCFYSLALKGDGTVWAWGRNNKGQLGDGTHNDSHSIPVQVQNLTHVSAIAAGSDYNLALKDDGTVWAWGANAEGQLGNGTNTNSDTPVQVIGLTNVAKIKIAGGGWHSMAIKNDGTVWTWGFNTSGQLGDGTKVHRNIPVQVKQ